ncbi:MAG: dephospho-CoA kinase [Planctomycetota bacterium]
MGTTGKKPIIGILGGIGSGKSTVAAEFAKLGCKVIDADKIAHELLDKPAVKEKVVGLFGRSILDPAGKIDREKLAEVVFVDPRPSSAGFRSKPADGGPVLPGESKNGDYASTGADPAALGSVQNPPMAGLNEIIHPLVLQRARELIKQYDCQNQVKAIVLDMPLLVEAGWDKRCDKLIFVDCEQKLRLDRAKKLGFDKNQVKIRENFQISLDNKANLADNTINNNSDFSELAKQVTDIFSYVVDNG